MSVGISERKHVLARGTREHGRSYSTSTASQHAPCRHIRHASYDTKKWTVLGPSDPYPPTAVTVATEGHATTAPALASGATAILGPDLYILHGVTLGSTGKPTSPGSKRHPTVGRGCTLGAGCAVLGDITLGDGAVVGASAVVTRDVPRGSTVVGVNVQRAPRARL